MKGCINATSTKCVKLQNHRCFPYNKMSPSSMGDQNETKGGDDGG